MFSLGTTLFELMTHRDLPGIVHDSDFSDEIKCGRRPRFLPKVCICSYYEIRYLHLRTSLGSKVSVYVY